MIIATNDNQRALLKVIYEKGLNNNLKGIKKLISEEVKDLEPYSKSVEAIYVTISFVDFSTMVGNNEKLTFRFQSLKIDESSHSLPNDNLMIEEPAKADGKLIKLL